MTTVQTLYLEDVDIGDEVTPQVRRITMDDVKAFGQVSPRTEMLDKPNRFNSEEQAKKEGLPGPVIPGAMSMALIAKTLTDWSPGVQLKTLDVILRQVVPQGTDIKIYGVVTDKDEEQRQVEVDIYVEPPEGQPFIRGKAVLGLPSRGS